MKKQYEDETTTLEVNLLPPSLRVELRRLQAIEAALKTTSDDPIMTGLAIMYESLIAAAPTGKLIHLGKTIKWPPTFDQCLDMSRAAFDSWAEWTFEANPGWKPVQGGDAEQEKKGSTSSGTPLSGESTA